MLRRKRQEIENLLRREWSGRKKKNFIALPTIARWGPIGYFEITT
jgi:hypothetical protein